MTRWSDEPETSAQALIGGALDELALAGTILLAETASTLPSILTRRGLTALMWRRRASVDQPATPEPPRGTFDTVLLRLPKSREEQRMASHLCLGTLSPGGRLVVYGGNDEGIRSFQKVLAELGPVVTIAARGHGRVLELKRAAVTGVVRPHLDDWREEHRMPGRSEPWISYPGLFAAGAPDPGTALLLAHLPAISPQTKVLDYGCGPGAIATAIRRAENAAVLTLLDNDSVALVAAAQNMPGAAYVLGGNLAAAGSQKFDLIISNPPLHVGFRETTEPLLRLIADAPAHLSAQGQLVVVVQRRIALDDALASAFGTIDILADDGRYRVWRAHGRRQASSAPIRLKTAQKQRKQS